MKEVDERSQPWQLSAENGKVRHRTQQTAVRQLHGSGWQSSTGSSPLWVSRPPAQVPCCLATVQLITESRKVTITAETKGAASFTEQFPTRSERGNPDSESMLVCSNSRSGSRSGSPRHDTDECVTCTTFTEVHALLKVDLSCYTFYFYSYMMYLHSDISKKVKYFI